MNRFVCIIIVLVLLFTFGVGRVDLVGELRTDVKEGGTGREVWGKGSRSAILVLWIRNVDFSRPLQNLGRSAGGGGGGGVGAGM